MSVSVAERYLELLHRRGVKYLFANAGTDFAPMAEAAARLHARGRAAPIPVIVPHENAAVSMAHGYTMVTGEPQAVMVHVGLGTGNAINGIYNAARQNVPMLFSAGRTPITETGLLGARSNGIHWAQEMFDQAGMVRELVKWDYELRHPDQLDVVVDRALALTDTDPKGPVYLTLPREVLALDADEGEVAGQPLMAPATAPQPDPGAIARLHAMLAAARRPVLITANSGRDPANVALLAEVAERHALPVVQYRPRHMCLPGDHPMHCGYDPAPLLADADLVVVVDHDVPWIPEQAHPPAGCPVVQIGVDPLWTRYPVRGFRTDLALTGETGAVLSALLAVDAPLPDTSERRAQVADFRAARARRRLSVADGPPGPVITTAWISACVDALRQPDDIVVNEYPFVLDQMTFTRPGTFFSYSSAGGLGWALGAALGAKLARPECTVIAGVGDGSYMFGNPTPAHFVSQACGLPVLFIVHNNGVWNAVRHATLGMYPNGAAARANRDAFSSLEPSPAYEKVVEASGGYGERVSDPAALPGALERALHAVKVEGRQALLNVLAPAA